MLVTQSGPQNTVGSPGGGHPSHEVRFGQFEFGVVTEQNGLVQDERIDGIKQSAAQMNVAGFDNLVPLSLGLTHPGVVTATDQAAATKDLFGMGVVVRVADGGGQTSHLQVTEALEFGPNLIRTLLDQSH